MGSFLGSSERSRRIRRRERVSFRLTSPRPRSHVNGREGRGRAIPLKAINEVTFRPQKTGFQLAMLTIFVAKTLGGT